MITVEERHLLYPVNWIMFAIQLLSQNSWLCVAVRTQLSEPCERGCFYPFLFTLCTLISKFSVELMRIWHCIFQLMYWPLLYFANIFHSYHFPCFNLLLPLILQFFFLVVICYGQLLQCHLLLFYLTDFDEFCLLTVRLPPTIIRHPVAYRIYKEGAQLVVLECVAIGSPTPRYGHINVVLCI